MALGIGSAMKEDLQAEKDKFDDSPLAITSAMKEDLEAERKKFEDGSTIIGSDNYEKETC